MGVADENWGSKKRDLYSLFGDQRRRVAPGLYEDIDRQWRQKYLQANTWTKKDMSYHLFHLWDNPEFRKDRLNIFRRIWQAPGEAFEHALRPVLGMEHAFVTKWVTSKLLWSTAFVWLATYQYLYNRGDWTKQTGFRSQTSKRMTVPEDASFPLPNPDLERAGPSDYYDMGFKKHPAASELKPSLPLKWD